jgi:hypothetical protein
LEAGFSIYQFSQMLESSFKRPRTSSIPELDFIEPFCEFFEPLIHHSVYLRGVYVNEEDLNVASKGENEKGKEELNDVEIMDQDDDEVIEDVDVEDEGEQNEEEYVPSSSSVKRNVKKQKKRVKSDE